MLTALAYDGDTLLDFEHLLGNNLSSFLIILRNAIMFSPT